VVFAAVYWGIALPVVHRIFLENQIVPPVVGMVYIGCCGALSSSRPFEWMLLRVGVYGTLFSHSIPSLTIWMVCSDYPEDSRL